MGFNPVDRAVSGDIEGRGCNSSGSISFELNMTGNLTVGTEAEAVESNTAARFVFEVAVAWAGNLIRPWSEGRSISSDLGKAREFPMGKSEL